MPSLQDCYYLVRSTLGTNPPASSEFVDPCKLLSNILGRGGVTFRLKAPMGMGIKKSAVQIFFVRLEGGDEDAFSAEQVIPSNYSKKKQVYLLNAKPGRYVAVAANLGSQATAGSMSPVGGGFSVGYQPPVMKYSAFFSMAMIPQTEVTVVPGEMVFMGDLLAKGSTKMENADAAQAHYYRMLSPEAAEKGYLARTFSGSAVYRAELESVSKDVATESSFWSRALKKVFKKEPAWQAFVQRQQQVLAGGTVPEQVVSQSFEQPSIEAVGDDAEVP